VRRPDKSFGDADPVKWHYTEQPDLNLARVEHDTFSNILNEQGVEVVFHSVPLPDHADAIFVHDPVLVTDEGAILLRMGKQARRGEEAAIGQTLADMGIPILARLEGEATAEGGDLLWIDHDTLAVGQGFRTNAAALEQLQSILNPLGVEVQGVHLPYFEGPEACLHLMSFISIVDHDLAVIYEPLMPVPFWQNLKARGFRFVRVPDEEVATLGPNVLAIAPSKCLMIDKNVQTIAGLRAAGCEVLTYVGDEISLKAEGGATCLTRPVLRE
jgi:N-dimethylarginine dimethylaminohydrolase